jgi:hypothetical protein
LRNTPHVPPLSAALAVLVNTWAGAQVPDSVRVELVGQSQSWTDARPVYETTDDSKFQSERYGADFHLRLHGMPPGAYTLKLGLAEMKFTEPGERVFSLSANGRQLLDHFDILTEVGNSEALVKAFRVTLDRPVLDLHFVGHQDNAKYCFLRIYSRDLVVEVPPDVPVARASRADRPDAPYMSGMYETSIGKFGSRVSFNPRPRSREWWQGALGHADYAVAYFEKSPDRWRDLPYEMLFATEWTDGETTRAYALPFTESVQSFPTIRQRITPTTLTYACRAPDLPYAVELTYSAPFYPQDLKLSAAPYVRLDVRVRDTAGQHTRGRFVVAQAGRTDQRTTPLEEEGLSGWVLRTAQFGKQTQQVWAALESDDMQATEGWAALPGEMDREETRDLVRDADGRLIVPVVRWQSIHGLSWQFEIGPGESAETSFVYVGWCDQPVLTTPERSLRFKYLEFFDSAEAVARYAFAEREAIDRRTSLFEETVLKVEGLPESFADLFSFAFQSWVMNTWYMSDEQGDWFSVWEGCCKFHSTVDVEYNIMPFYLLYWPELARLTLDEWGQHEDAGVMPHDMGMGFEIGAMKYPHDMEVEEATNYVLLLHAYWRMTGDVGVVKRHLTVADRLLDYVNECDTDRDGFPEKGTSNTIDQGSRAIQHGPKQVYLAVKALSAFQALADMAQAAGEREIAREQAERAGLVAATLRDAAWLDDHYAVALKPTVSASSADEVVDDWDPDAGWGGHEADSQTGWGRDSGMGAWPPEPPSGWDGYSIYASNGSVDMDEERLRADVLGAARRTLKRFGAPHTDHESNTWISQNMWRDMTAAYLGLDLLDNAEGYWQFEVDQNRNRRGCFTDVYNYGGGSTSLDYYPRGIAVAGFVPAAAGLQLDRVTGTVSLAPIRLPLRVPLTALADWDGERVPWASISVVDDSVSFRVTPRELVDGLAVSMRSGSE